ncbi:MAG: TolC family protein [Planctomycetota bacterium]
MISPAFRPCSGRRGPLPASLLVPLFVVGCTTPVDYLREADADAYTILGRAHEQVTGEQKAESIGGHAGPLRRQMESDLAQGLAPTVHLDIPATLDVAARNSRDFMRQKETLFRTALALSTTRRDFELRWAGGTTAGVDGTGNGVDAVGTLSEDLSASVRSPSGTRVVASFVNNLFKNLLSGGDGVRESSLLGLTITQPLLRGAGARIVREQLTQAERDVVYAVRSFERFRATFAVDVFNTYLSLLEQIQNLESQRRNLDSVRRAREQIERLFAAGRRQIGDLDRARQNELSAQNNLLNGENQLQTSLDNLKEQLGLPMQATIELDPAELQRLSSTEVKPIDLDVDRAVALALSRRYDYRTALDRVEDAARQLFIAENALESTLDFSAAITVPTEPGKALVFDWSQVSWSAGFDLGLALDRLIERNAYRASFITLDERMRARDELKDNITQQIRLALRDIQTRVQNWTIQKEAVTVAERRVDSQTRLYDAGRASALDLLDAQDSLLSANISLTSATVDYTLSKLRLLRDLEGLAVQESGLRFDFDLPVPDGAQEVPDNRPRQ